MNSLIASFGETFWENKIEEGSLPRKLCSKPRVFVCVMYKILDRKGTKRDLLIVTEACIPTEWLVKFLTSWKTSVDQNSLKRRNLIDFIESLIEKLGNTYTLLIDGTGEHHVWIQEGCMSLSAVPIHRKDDNSTNELKDLLTELKSHRSKCSCFLRERPIFSHLE